MTDNTEAIRDEIHRNAAARAEALIYVRDNPYLTQRQKVQVECIHQFPLGVFEYSFAVFALIFHHSVVSSFVGASLIGSVAWLFARFLPGRLVWPIGLFFFGNASMLICLISAGYAMFLHLYGVAIFLALSGYGFTSFVAAPTWLWNLTNRGMNSRYRIAKRMYEITFPFEADLAR